MAGRMTQKLSLQDLMRRHVRDGHPVDAVTEAALRADGRPTAQQLLAAIDRRRAANRAEGQRLRRMLRYERDLWSKGVVHVAGVDEAGMSPLAGPVAAAAVIFAPETKIAGVDDSKKLNAETRDRLADEIKMHAVAWSIGFADVAEIDTINIYWAGLLAMRRAVEGLACTPCHVLIDARRIRDLPLPQQPIVKGDSKSLSIAAASILAKTSRDAVMRDLDRQHPDYGFAQHKGYPVRAHVEALRAHGACAAHRRSFAPVREALGLPPLPPWPDRSVSED
jgi:ribonuclease HII